MRLAIKLALALVSSGIISALAAMACKLELFGLWSQFSFGITMLIHWPFVFMLAAFFLLLPTSE